MSMRLIAMLKEVHAGRQFYGQYNTLYALNPIGFAVPFNSQASIYHVPVMRLNRKMECNNRLLKSQSRI